MSPLTPMLLPVGEKTDGKDNIFGFGTCCSFSIENPLLFKLKSFS
jgi:hypothetical protein